MTDLCAFGRKDRAFFSLEARYILSAIHNPRYLGSDFIKFIQIKIKTFIFARLFYDLLWKNALF